MYEKMNTVRIGGKKLPIKCNFSVLQRLQEEFGTLKQFEQKLIGMNPVLDEKGDFIYEINAAGQEVIKYTTSEPSLKAIGLALPIMINEGKLQAERQGDEIEDFDYKEAIKEADFSIIDVAVDLHNEYRRCFDRKKLKASNRTPIKK